jgi:iron complex outermembrane receptor protein
MEKLYKRLFLTLALCSSFSLLFGQSLTGKVTDSSGAPLPGIQLHIQGLTTATSNHQGEYFFKLPSRGSYRLKISSAAFQPQTADVFVTSNQVKNFSLQPVGAAVKKESVSSSRASALTSTESSVPVEIITAEELKVFAQKDITQILNYAQQSFGSNRQTISDGTDHIDPVSLRGLGPDQLLVLVNGKRFHSSALVNIDETFGRGAAGTDMNSIPVSSIERIEILKARASAQYGSDAISGVINIILKNNSPFNMSMSFGQTVSNTLGRNFNDGKTFQLAYSEGIDLVGRGSLNFSGQYLFREATNRGAFDTRPLLYSAAPVKGNCECDADFQKRYSELKNLDDLRALASGMKRDNLRVGNAESSNGGFSVNGHYYLLKNVELYLTAAYALKAGESAGMFRLPNQYSQIDPTMYPNGFLPMINTGIQDLSVASGFRGKLAGWNYDLSHITGKNKIDFHIAHSLNASLPLGTSPDNFNSGELAFRQNTSNLDLSRKFDFNGLVRSLNTAFGAEFKADNYEIGAGEELSYSFGQPSKAIAGRKMSAGYGEAGAQVFPGFTPENSLNKTRSNTALYADLETGIGSKVRIGLAGRLENYSDFGSNFSYQTSGRYNFYKSFSLRGGFSTGFREPSLHQQYFNNESNSIIQGTSTSTLIANSESNLVRQFGAGSLSPELSDAFSVGLTGNLLGNLSLTADAYRINIRDRIILTGLFSRERDLNGTLIQSGAVNQVLNKVDPFGYVNGVQFFANAVSTRTQGLDISLNDRVDLRRAGQNLTFTAALSLNQSSVNKVNAPEIVKNSSALQSQFFTRQERARIESSIPDHKVILGAQYADRGWGAAIRSVRFGEVSYTNAFDPAFPENTIAQNQVFSAKWITDMSLNYTFTNELNIALGVSNLMDIYPDRLYMDPNNRENNFSSDPYQNYISSAARDNTANGRIQYSPNVTQFGFNGRHVFGKLTYSL